MAIIRMAASAGAALIALAAIVPAASQAQAPKAPLQLVPGPDQAKPATRASNKAAKPVRKPAANASSKAVRTAAARKMTRQTAAAAQPSSKAAANAVANKRQARRAAPINAQRARVAASKPRARPAAAPRPVPDRAQPVPQIFAQGASGDGDDHVMRDGDSISLVGRLPWWRNDGMQTVNYGSAEAESKVLEAAAVWLAANGLSQTDQPVHEPVAPAAAETIEVADPDEVNDIDRAAESAPPTPTFLQSLLALIGGAASAVAATVRQLFA